MQVFVCNREQAEIGFPTEIMWALDAISISTPGDEYPVLAGYPGAWDKIMRLRFHDITPGAEGWAVLQGFTEQQAAQVLDWLDDLDPNEPILVHCDAGTSRSVAIGRWIAARSPRELIILTPGMRGVDTLYNVHVWNLLYREWYRREEEKEKKS